jgi:hypothetical protein
MTSGGPNNRGFEKMLLKKKVMIKKKNKSLSSQTLTLLSSPNMVQSSLTWKEKKTIKNQYQWEFGAIYHSSMVWGWGGKVRWCRVCTKMPTTAHNVSTIPLVTTATGQKPLTEVMDFGKLSTMNTQSYGLFVTGVTAPSGPGPPNS